MVGQAGGHPRAAHQAQPQRRLREHVVVFTGTGQRTPQNQVRQRLLLAHGRLGEDLRGRLFGAAGKANPGNHVIGLAHRFDVQVRLRNRPGKQQASPADGQLLTIGPVAAIDQAQFAAGVQVVADMKLPRQIGVQPKTGERQQLLAHHHVDVHVDHHRG